MLKIIKDQFCHGTSAGVNFYFESDRLAVSDNHRMAYWFFSRKARLGTTLVHVDTHTDCSNFFDEDYVRLRRAMPRISTAESFANACVYDKRSCGDIPLVRYGNWIPALHKMNPEILKHVLLRCHNTAGVAVPPDLSHVSKITDNKLFERGVFSGPKVCLSFDVDYYFKHEQDVYSLRDEIPDPLEHFRSILSEAKKNSHVPIFIALSPQCCGGWSNVKPFITVVDNVFDISLGREITGRLPCEQDDP